MSDENIKAIEYCEELNRLERENPTPKSEVNFVLKPENGKLVLYRVEEWEREGSVWEIIDYLKTTIG